MKWQRKKKAQQQVPQSVKQEKRPGVRRNIANGYSSRKPAGVRAVQHASRRDTHRGSNMVQSKAKGEMCNIFDFSFLFDPQ
jgi:hypothetical protein